MGRYLRLQVWRERILARRYVARMQVGCIGWLDLRCHTYQNIIEFWRLIGEVVGQDLPGMDCAERLRALRAYQVGLCDVVAEDATLEGGRQYDPWPRTGLFRCSRAFKCDCIGTPLPIHGVDGFMRSVHKAIELETEQACLLRPCP